MPKCKEKIMNYYNRFKWLIEHGFAAVAAVSITLGFRWLVINWQAEIVIKRVDEVAVFLDKYIHYIEPILTLTIFILFATLGRVIKHYRKGGMSIAAGMFFYSPHLKERQVEKSEQFLRREASKCVHIHLLGSSGWNTFGHSDSPLHNGLQVCEKAEIILMNPYSDALEKRAENIGQDAAEYRQEIIQSLQYIKTLKDIGDGDNANRIEVKMYQSYPGWKFIILGRYCWVQQYPISEHVRNSPCYAFQRIPQWGIYGHFFSQFQRRWDSLRLGKYNFDSESIEFYNESGEMINEKSLPISSS